MKHQLWTLMVAWNNILRVENSDRGVHFYVGLEAQYWYCDCLWTRNNVLFVNNVKGRYCRYVDIVGRYSHLSQMLSSEIAEIEFYTFCTFSEL